MITSSERFNQNILHVLSVIEKDLLLRKDQTSTLRKGAGLSMTEIFEVIRYLKRIGIAEQIGASDNSTLVWDGVTDSLEAIDWVLVKINDRELFNQALNEFRNPEPSGNKTKQFVMYISDTRELVFSDQKDTLPFVYADNRPKKLMEIISPNPNKEWSIEDIARSLDLETTDENKKVYDAVRALNKTIHLIFQIPDLIEIKDHKIRFKQSYISDINK